jgi:hypothetical protein
MTDPPSHGLRSPDIDGNHRQRWRIKDRKGDADFQGGDFRHPWACTQLPSLDEIPVTAPHQLLAILDQTNDPRSKVMALPRAILQPAASGQQHQRDLPISVPRGPGIQRTEFQDQARARAE